ncbi:Disease resistance protein, partial [Mucuna pruriens]
MKPAAVARQFSYLISNKSILENLMNELKNLQDQSQKVQENLTWDSEDYQTQSSWLNKVDEIAGQVNGFLNYYEGKGTCTNFLWRYKVGKQSRKMKVDISKLHEDGQSYLSAKPAKDYKGPKSRADTMHDIMEALMDTLIQTIGVWGLGGVGITTLAKQVGEQAKEEKLFDVVVFITITEKPKVEKVQEDIAAELGVQFNEETLMKRRNKLRQRIKKEKQILVIVDDKWGELNPQEFDLEEFGVPLGDEHAGCKLLLTSGNLNFIQNLKGAPKPKVFQLEVLKEDEAQSLFEKMVGGVAEDPEASSIVIEIVKSCEGSISSIFAIAKALENKGRDALVQLKENVSPIKLLSNSLEDEELKSLLLLLTIRGRRAINKYSIYTDMWTGLFKNLETLDAARNRRDSLINDLKAYGLLVEDEKESVKIDDFIWQTAYSIAQNDLKALMISKELPPEDWLRGLCFCNINEVSGLQVPERLQCPNLQQLVMSTISPSTHVPHSFFEETKLLKVLNFVGFDCSKLPNSFVSLKNLEALSMHKCKLGDITEVGELTNLRVLELIGSSIKQLPAQIGKLQKLLLLDLRDTYLQVIPPHILSNLTSLEELYLRNSFFNWEIEISTNANNNASLKELTNLDHLTYIEDLYVPDPQAWPVELFFGKLKSYTIFIGDSWDRKHDGDHGLKTLKLKLKRRFQPEDGIKKMLESVDVLYLDELNGVQNVLNDLDCDGFPHLQSLVIQHNAEIKCIATRLSHDPFDAFPNLESLFLNNLSNLEHICHGPLIEKSFFTLRVIKVQKCDAMGSLFSNSMVNSLPHLANMEVSECKSMKTIVLMEGEENPLMEFPELCSLTLRALPKLISFCSSERTSFIDTPTFFHDKVSCPNMETMMISQVSEMITLWNEAYDVPNSFWKLKNVNITHCEKLRTIFPVNLSKNLHNLKILEVRNCNSMTSIFTVMRQDNKQPGLQLSIPMISINLVELPKLEYVCVTTGFESLKRKFEEEWHSYFPRRERVESEKRMKKFLEEHLNM